MKKLATLILAACACASAPPAAEPQTRLVTAPPPPPQREQPFDARTWVADQTNASECEAGARRIHERNAAQGWDALRACVEKPSFSRGQFTQLNLLVSGYWDQELQTRPEAARLAARIIALRGGDVEGDLPQLQKSRAPVFSLAAALSQPNVYKGRWLVVRGRMGDLRSEGQVHTALLSESSLRSAEREVNVGLRTRSQSESSHSGSARIETTRYGNARIDASARSDSRSTTGQIKSTWENEKVITGRQALGRLAQPDPFLEPNKDFIFLARFDGVRPNSDGDDVGVLSIVSYFPPNALLVE